MFSMHAVELFSNISVCLICRLTMRCSHSYFLFVAFPLEEKKIKKMRGTESASITLIMYSGLGVLGHVWEENLTTENPFSPFLKGKQDTSFSSNFVGEIVTSVEMIVHTVRKKRWTDAHICLEGHAAARPTPNLSAFRLPQ